MDDVTKKSASIALKTYHHLHPTAAAATPSGTLSKASSDDAKEAAEYAAKYKIYERDYVRRINHKYFCGKNLAGTGRVFETVTALDGFTVKESRDKPIKRFLELPGSSEEHTKSGAAFSDIKQSTRKR